MLPPSSTQGRHTMTALHQTVLKAATVAHRALALLLVMVVVQVATHHRDDGHDVP